jgi:hypothetical protein
VKDGSDLSERLDHLKSALRLLIDQRRKVRNGSSRNAWFPFAAVAGGVYSVELVIGSGSGLWHPHVHVYALCDQDFDLDGTRCPEMEAWWLERTGDSFVIDCRPIEGNEQRGSACLEVLKYATKFSSMTLRQNVIAWRAASGRRLMQSFGCLAGVRECEVLTDELSKDEGDFIDLYYRFVKASPSTDMQPQYQCVSGDNHQLTWSDQVSPQEAN